MYSIPSGGQADVTMPGVSAEGEGLTKENFMFVRAPENSSSLHRKKLLLKETK
jgi:hypothetical protein